MARKRNPRRLALEIIANAKRLAAGMSSHWTVESTVYTNTIATDANGREYYTNTPPRKREAHEYPENNAQDWAILFHMAQELEKHAQALKDLALANYRDLKESGK